MSLSSGKLKIGSVTKDCKGDRGGWKRDELVKEAKKRGIEVHSKMTKSDLCDLLLEISPPVVSPRVKKEEVKTWQEFQTYASQQSPRWGRRKRSEEWKILKGSKPELQFRFREGVSPRKPPRGKKGITKVAVEEIAPQGEMPSPRINLEVIERKLSRISQSDLGSDTQTLENAPPAITRRVSLELKSRKSRSPRKLSGEAGELEKAYQNLKETLPTDKRTLAEAKEELKKAERKLATAKKAVKNLESKVNRQITTTQTAREALSTAEARLEQIKGEKARAKQQETVDEAIEAKVAAEAELEKLQSLLTRRRAQVDDLDIKISGLRDEAARLEESLTRANEVIKALEAAT